MQKNIFIRPILITAALLFISFVSMQFSSEANWGIFDFIVAGALVFTVGFIYELIARKMSKSKKIIIGLAILGITLWLWAELAVGVFTRWGS